MGLFQRKKKRTPASRLGAIDQYILTEESPFAVQEAYKTLRTNLIFSIPGDECRKILVTSSMQAEAKSTTTVNLGIAFAQNKSKVLVIDCDLRLPTIGPKLGIEPGPGLSNVLVGMCSVGEAICHLPNGLDVMQAGDIPPNPTELLGSDKMSRLLDALGEWYDYILLDTPPVCTVSDAVILAKYTSGAMLIVRQDFATEESISEALDKLEFSEVKILGFVFTGVANGKQKSYQYKKYGYERSTDATVGRKKG